MALGVYEGSRKRKIRVLFQKSNEIVIFFLTSFLKLILFSLSLIQYLKASQSSLFNSPSPSGVVSSCLRHVCNDGLPRIRHGAGIYQDAEQGNLDKSDMCEHASISSFLLLLVFYVYPKTPKCSLFLTLTQFPFPLPCSGKNYKVLKRTAGLSDAQKQLCHFNRATRNITLYAISVLCIELFIKSDFY